MYIIVFLNVRGVTYIVQNCLPNAYIVLQVADIASYKRTKGAEHET